MCLGVSFFHITKNVVLDPWVINCAGVSTGCHHFPRLNPAACSALQRAHHSQLHKSVLCYTPTAPTCRSVSNVIVMAPSNVVQKPLKVQVANVKKGEYGTWLTQALQFNLYLCVCTYMYMHFAEQLNRIVVLRTILVIYQITIPDCIVCISLCDYMHSVSIVSVWRLTHPFGICF